MQERFLAFLHEIEFTIGLALHAFQPGLDHLPLGAVDHHRDAGDVGFGGDQVEERGHGGGAVDQPFVHVHVDDLRPVFDLIARHVQRGGEIARGDQLAKARGPGDVGAFAHVHERDFRGLDERLQPGQAQAGRDGGQRARRGVGHPGRDGGDMVGRRSAAAADHVHQPFGGEFGDLAGHVVGRLIILPHLVRQPGVGIGADQRVANIRQFGQMRVAWRWPPARSSARRSAGARGEPNARTPSASARSACGPTGR